ncbi:MAG: endolytic transglycosylase MltG [Clostridia bacterium]|nr:endolytic transglycosylase MltG [Clostridia bacterium]
MNYQEKHSDIIDLGSAERIRRAAAIIIPLCFLSLFLALLIVSYANDIYAFVKPERAVTVDLSACESVKDIAKALEAQDVIKNPNLFTLYVRSKNAEERLLSAADEIELNTAMSYREILKVFAKNQKSE